MRALLLVALVACGGSSDESCPLVLTSDVQHAPGGIVSGKHLVGVSWTRRTDITRREIHAAIVSPDGTVSPDIALADERVRGATGTTTLLWTPHNTCVPAMNNEDVPFNTILQRGGEVTFVDRGPTYSRVAIFDGQRYQLFWITTTSGSIHHQSLDEDGTLGPVHVLPVIGYCVDAASDGAGTTFIRIDNSGYIVDTSAGTTNLVFTNTQTLPQYRPLFFFGQSFHIVDRTQVFSISPSEPGMTRTRMLANHLEGAHAFDPSDATMYVSTARGIVEVDTAWAKLRDVTASHVLEFGAFDGDLVHFDEVPPIEETETPARVELVREGVWRTELAVDSALHLDEQCGDLRP